MLLENNPYPQDGRVRREAMALVMAGYAVTVIAPGAKGQRLQERVDGVRVCRYRTPPESDGALGYVLEYGYALVAAVVLSVMVYVRWGFAIIHAHNPPDIYVLVAALFKPFGVRFVFDHHDLSPEMYQARFGKSSRRMVHRALLFFERLTFQSADHVISTNDSYAAIASERGGVPSESITVVRNGPDPARVRLLPPDDALRAKASFIIGYVGEMAPQDGVDYLIRSLAVLESDLGREDFFSVIIGSGSDVPRLRVLARDLGLEEKVWFAGQINDPDRLMTLLSTTDICVAPDPSNPYTDRSTVVKLAEYMALGKPIVAFDLPEHRRTAGDAATYATPNNEEEFAKEIAMLMDDPERRDRMGAIGAERVARELAWGHQAARLLEAYASVLGNVTEAGTG